MNPETTLANIEAEAETVSLNDIERWLHSGRFDKARAGCDAWLARSPTALDSQDGARVVEYLGGIAEQTGSFLVALSHYDVALKAYLRHDNIHGQCRIHYASATVYRRTGQSDLSFDRVAILSKLAEHSDDALVNYYAVRAHAASLALNSKIDEAEALMQTAIELATRSGNARAVALAYTGMIGVLVNQVEHAFAEKMVSQQCVILERLTQLAERNIEFCEQAGFSILQCICLNNWASALNTLGQADASLPIIERQLALARRIESRSQTGWALSNVAQHALIIKDLALARPTLVEALDIAFDVGEVSLETGVLQQLIELHKTENEWEAAFKYFERFHEHKMRSSRAFADAQIKILKLELDNARAQAAALLHEAQVAELAIHAMQLASKAEQDALTGLINRHGFERLAGAAMARLEHSHTQLSMAMIDLDNLKPINDQHSHLIGDAALKHVAETIIAQCRKTDIAVRLGGDEFVIVFEGLSASDAKEVCARMQVTLRQATALAVFPVALTVSIGIAETATPVPLDELIAKADAALYRAKALGRNRIELA